MNQNHQNHQISVMQYLTVLDKCTQIIRQDRIWLRNEIKNNNQDALYLFKGLSKNIDMKQLQIRLRKYINRAKQREKQQQLIRFKENMHLPEFIQAAQRKQHSNNQNRSQTKRAPLYQNQQNTQKNSIVGKWNNYTHHHNHSNNFIENKSEVAEASTISHNKTQLQKNDWITNYKPHSFNKSLNGELANKLSYKNKSTSNIKKHNQTANLSKGKHDLRGQKESSLNSTQTFGYNGRNSSNSLKQLENKIYEELRQFQNSKSKKQLDNFNKTHSLKSGQRYFQKDRPSLNNGDTQKSVNLSKQNIDEILKFKLGNVDFDAFKKQKYFENQEEEEQQYCLKQNSSSQKKFLNQGYFPPIQEQTQRDSQSQRYQEEPMRFGLNSINLMKQEFQDRHKFAFSSFAKASSNQLQRSFNGSAQQQKGLTLNNLPSDKKQNIQEFTGTFYIKDSFEDKGFMNQSFNNNSKQSKTFAAQLSPQFQRNFTHVNCQEQVQQNRISESVYQVQKGKVKIVGITLSLHFTNRL